MGPASVDSLNQMLASYTEGCTEVLGPVELGRNLEAVTASQRYSCIRRVRNSDGFTAIHVAATKGHTRVVSSLLDSFSQQECYELVSIAAMEEDTAVHRAAHAGHATTVDALLSLISSDDRYRLLCQQDYWKFTPLHYSACNGHTETLELLLTLLPMDSKQRLEALEVKNEHMLTALDEAEKSDHKEIVELLRQCSSDADEKRKASIEHLDKRILCVEEELARYKTEQQIERTTSEKRLEKLEIATKRKNEKDATHVENQEKRLCGLERRLEAKENKDRVYQADCQKQHDETQRKHDNLEQSQHHLHTQLNRCCDEVQTIREEVDELQTQSGAEQPVDSFPESVMEELFPVQETGPPRSQLPETR